MIKSISTITFLLTDEAKQGLRLKQFDIEYKLGSHLKNIFCVVFCIFIVGWSFLVLTERLPQWVWYKHLKGSENVF